MKRSTASGLAAAYAAIPWGSIAVADPAAGSATLDATSVTGVVVTATRPKEQVLLDRKVYTVTGDLQHTVGVAADILNQIPSVDVDADGNISLRGDGNVTILVDGKPSAQFTGANQGAALRQFPAADIDRIEVMTNPPAQYRAEGAAGVINIITHKTRKAGLSGTGSLSLGDKRRYVAGLDGAYTVGRLKLSGGLSLRQDARLRVVADSRAAVDPASGETVLSQETLTERLRRLIPQVKLGADYDLGERQTLALSFSHREQSGNRYFDQFDESAGPTGPPTSVSLRHSDGHEWNDDTSEGIRFDGKLWRPGETLSLSFQRSTTHERERYAYLNTTLTPSAPPSRDGLRLSLDLATVEASADYVLPLPGSGELKAGYDYQADDNRFDNVADTIDPVSGAVANNPAVTSHFRFRQRIHTVYGELEAPLGPWTMQTGLRLEDTTVHTLLITGDTAGGYSYFRAYPSLNLDRPLWGQARLSLSASRRISRPDPEALNPFIDSQDVHNLRAGDANLLPQDTWSYEAGYTDVVAGMNLGVTGYYRFNRDSQTSVTTVRGPDVVLTTNANLAKSKAAGLDFSVGGRILPQLTFSLSGNGFYSQLDASGLGGAGLRSTIGLNGKASLDYKPTAADAVQMSFSRTDRRLTPQGSVGAINLVNLGYRRRLWSNLSAVFTVSDALDGQRFTRDVAIPTLQDHYSRHQIGRVAYAGLSWTFGAPKKAKTPSFDYDP